MKTDILGGAAVALCLLLTVFAPVGNSSRVLASHFSVDQVPKQVGKFATTGIRSTGPLIALASSPAQRHAHH